MIMQLRADYVRSHWRISTQKSIGFTRWNAWNGWWYSMMRMMCVTADEHSLWHCTFSTMSTVMKQSLHLFSSKTL